MTTTETTPTSTICPGDLEHLRHALGCVEHVPRRDWGYRNHFVPGSGADVASWERLVAAGLAQRGRPYCDWHFYHATRAGCLRAGLSERQVVRMQR